MVEQDGHDPDDKAAQDKPGKKVRREVPYRGIIERYFYVWFTQMEEELSSNASDGGSDQKED